MLRKSPCRTVTPIPENRDGPCRWRSKTVTACPERTRESTTCEPMKPLPPITRHLATHGPHDDVDELTPRHVPGEVHDAGGPLGGVLGQVGAGELLEDGRGERVRRGCGVAEVFALHDL